jgi:PAS domain-containing protein
MGEVTVGLLQLSSDPIVVIRSADGTILEANEALQATIGRTRDELIGRMGADLFIGIGPASGALIASAFGVLGPVTDLPIGLRGRSGAWRVGRLSALVVDIEGDQAAVCTIRELREPLREERLRGAREELSRILDSGRPTLGMAVTAIGTCLGWELVALWLPGPGSRARCQATWRAPTAQLQALEQLLWRTTLPVEGGLIGRTWSTGTPAWAGAVAAAADLGELPGAVGTPIRARLAFPAPAGGGTAGVVDLMSTEDRPPDEELLRMTEPLGGLMGQLIGLAGTDDTVLADDQGRGASAAQAPPETVSSALREVAEVVEAIADVLDQGGRSPDMASVPQLAEEMSTKIDRLGRLPAAADAAVQRPSHDLPGLPAGLTLKAVSRRTGVPVATLRTWQRRYGFLRPIRSAGGVRLYGEADVERVIKLRRLMDRGMRAGAAAAAITEADSEAGQPIPEVPPERAEGPGTDPGGPPG